MKNPHRNRARRCSLLFGLTLAAVTFTGNAATYTWDVRSGLLPNQVDETMRLHNSRATNSPVLTADGLLIHTDTTDYGAAMYYFQETTNLAVPTQLVIEANLKVVTTARRADQPPYQSGVLISFVTATGLGNVLLFDTNKISLWVNGAGGTGPTASVITTDGFHRCRIEVDTPTVSGAPLRVFWDDALVITSGIYRPLPGSGATQTPEISFGDGSSGGSGTSYWRYFSHNAAARTPGVRLSIAPAVEICWWAETNKTYQVESMPRLGTNDWTSFGLPINGDDSTRCVFDSTRGQPQKSYRVVTLPEM